MKFRQISIIIGILILIGAIFLTRFLMSSGTDKEEKVEKEEAQAVKIRLVKNDTVPAFIPITGRLEGQKRIEIFAEVQGRFIRSSKAFKEGIAYEEGEVLIQMDNREARLSLQSQKSNLMNGIAKMLPDLKIDYPKHHQRWQDYLENLKVDEPLEPLPKVDQQQVKYFVTARNIYNQYYSIQSQAERLSKYTIRAPFDGVVTESLIDPGTLVRPGQKLGEYIATGRYEMKAALSARELALVDKKDSVALWSDDISGRWAGKVVRINEKIDAETQSAQVFVGTSGEPLKEGMYLEGKIYTGSVPNAYEVLRKYVEENDKVWIIKNDKLKKHPIEVVHTSQDKAIVKGLPDGTQILDESIPTAYVGMPVKPVKAENL